MNLSELPQLILSSYQRLLGESLVPTNLSAEEATNWLQHDAPFAILAHNTASDPCFIYANQTAQNCFEYSHAELIGLPSRLSAEAPNREERAQLLASVNQRGFSTGYRGLRIAKSGRRFWIENATVWNLIDEAGIQHGQAALLREWRDWTAED
ncbi:MEKHLA domain-containing protein [Deefgea tanakiae]|uniref:MEKHLA domain-containing protein n=1 Tax=Deefgea tanakiae TaxID=2865840 RepID=A0ABX8Z438_9NEIS|nr:MEKHLA domain-containing protein [Deefgea tanakiae]QZA77140.1 MEKHLA domain-containing protein [Deefgea tanakiae]